MPNKAVSKKQFNLFQGIKHGSIPPKGGLSPEKASEMLGDQSPKGLPNTAPKTIDQWDKTGAYAAPVSKRTKARANQVLNAGRKKG